MLREQLKLTHEQTSPLFRLMWLQDSHEPQRHHFDNNICAFHIGGGYVLSVAHNLKAEAKSFKSIPQELFETQLKPRLNSVQLQLMERCFPLDETRQKRFWNTTHSHDYGLVVDVLKQIHWDTRWLTQMELGISKPHLIVQFKGPDFYNDPQLTALFPSTHRFAEPPIHRNTFLLEVALVEAFYQEDIALYRIVNTPTEVVAALPSLAIDYSILPDSQVDYYCLQSSPTSEIGKLLNKAQIEGFTDHFSFFKDPIGGNYTLEGLRYLIKGYFRFGSSGAPYVVYDNQSQQFKVNAIQSEACPIQLSIDHKQDGNYQYVNAIASPLYGIQDRLQAHLRSQTP